VANISADDAEDFIAYYAAHPSDDPDGFACQVTVGENVYNAVYYPAVTAQDPVYENGILITPAVEAQEPKLEINQPVYEITSNEVDEDGHPLDFSDLGISSLDTPLYYDYQNAITCTMTIGTGDTAHQVTGTYNPVTKQLTYQETLDVTEADEWLVCTNTDEVMDALTLISQRHYGSEFTTEDLSANALTDPAVLRELVYNAYAIIQAQIYDEDTGRHEWKDTSVATNVGLRERTDDEQLAKAEAEYEAALRRIDRKEQQYDKELAKFDQERKALTTQLDTLKTCIKENIDRTFKIFQG
ncbi:hypothetical protein IJI31_02250, partial [bacterium]|nr:hypothetical protein [bacterium]